MNKKIKVLIVLSFLFILVFGAAYSYSRYSTIVSGAATADVADWNITVNGCNIASPDKNNTNCFREIVNEEDNSVIVSRNFNITEFTYRNNSNAHVVNNKMAPGSSGTFKITIEPNDTQVSIKYKLNVELDKHNPSIVLYRTDPNKTNKVLMEPDGYEGILQYTRDGFIYIDSTGKEVSAEKMVFTIYVEWANKEENNVYDTVIGTNGVSPTLDIPVNITFEQYLG